MLHAAVKRKAKAAGLNQVELAEMLDIKSPYLSQIESGKRGGSRALWLRAADVLGLSVGQLLTGEEDLTPTQPGLHVPIEAFLIDGHVQDNTIKHGLQREGPAPRVELVQVEGAGEDWKACKITQRAWVDLDAGAISYELRPADLVILRPHDDGELAHGMLVVATKKITSAEELEAARNEDGHVVIPRELRVYLEVHGQTWLWPLQGEGQPTTAVQPVAPWRVVEVAVKQRRELVPEIEGG